MPILNYRTRVGAVRTVGEIHEKLAKAGASAIMNEYQDGVISRLSFKVTTKHGEHAFQLPANVEGVFQAMQREPKIARGDKTRERAAAVAWRILKDWIEAQLAIIEADMATLPQVFLPYMQVGPNETIYDRFEKQGFPALTFKDSGA